MTVTSQTLIGMSERGLLPKKLLKESRHGTYPYALAVIAVLIAVSQPLDFHALVLVCECFSVMLCCVLFVTLRSLGVIAFPLSPQTVSLFFYGLAPGIPVALTYM